MMRRLNIPEGASFSQMPRFIGWGRVLPDDWIHEHYFTLAAFGWRLFVARGNYRTHWWPTQPQDYSWRWWLRRQG